jgi:hypothetical protein
VSHGGEVTTIDAPGAALTQPLGINDRGDVVGAYVEAVPGPDPYGLYEAGRLRGFVMRGGRFTPIDFPGAEGTRVSGINRGDIVIPADGTVIRQPETACGRRTAPGRPSTTLAAVPAVRSL